MSDKSSAAMGGHAWSSTPRQEPPQRAPSERLRDFLEIEGCLDEQSAREQALRCIQCPDPACVAACPLALPIAEWLNLTADGQVHEAAAVLHATGNIPEICARLCPADQFCEGACLIQGRSEPVAIRSLSQFLTQYAFSHPTALPPSAPASGWRVAVVGATPGGIAAADALIRRGHAVTVFEAGVVVGQLVHGIPAFRLERAHAERRIAILEQQGVVFRPGVSLGTDIMLDELRSAFDCVYLAFPARTPRTLAIPGAGLRGVAPSVPFIVQQNAAAQVGTPASVVEGKRVVVLGGDESGVDCVRTALRCGARQVIGVHEGNPESLHGGIRELNHALTEGAEYLFNTTALALLGTPAGNVRGLRLRRVLASGDSSSAATATFPNGVGEFEIPADDVFVALGSEPWPGGSLASIEKLARSEAGTLVVGRDQMTGCAGVFAGGDLTRGPCLTIEAIRDARRAADGIEEYLRSPAAAGMFWRPVGGTERRE